MKTTKPLAFYAHAMVTYGTPSERRDLKVLRALGFRVINPGDKRYEEYSTEEFKALTLTADVLAFRALEDGTVSSGIQLGIIAAQAADIPIIELGAPKPERYISRNATRKIMGMRPLPTSALAGRVTSILANIRDYDEPLDHDWGNS